MRRIATLFVLCLAAPLVAPAALAGPAASPTVLLSREPVAEAALAQAKGVTQLAKNRFNEASLVVQFGGRTLKEVVGEVAPNAIEDALAVTILAEPKSTKEELVRWMWRVENLSTTGRVLPLQDLWPQRNGISSTFPAFLEGCAPGTRLTFQVDFRQLLATGAQVRNTNGELVPERVWKSRGPERLATVVVEVAPFDVALPAAEVILKAIGEHFERSVVQQFPAVPQGDLDASEWSQRVGWTLDEVRKTLGTQQNTSILASNYRGVEQRLKYTELKQDAEPVCTASAKPGFVTCKWPISARLEVALMTQDKPSGMASFLGSRPAEWKPRFVPMTCSWKVQARVDNQTQQIGAQQDWYGASCKILE